MNKLLIAALTALLVTSASANEIAVAPAVSPDALPPLGEHWRSENPYRTVPEAVAIGQQAYSQACARCHGADAATNAAPAPDLRRLNGYCRRIEDAELKATCLRDNDAYFAKTVRQGKVILGVTHMPPWEGVLKQELAWAIQVFVERQAQAKPMP